MTMLWFVLFIILILIEIFTVGLVSIWFAIGSIAAMIVSLFTDSFLIQLCSFIVVSLITLFLMKPLVKKFKNTSIIPTNIDRIIGKKGEVIQKISHNSYGQVKIMGNVWTASCEEELEEGTRVIVKKIDGVKLIVEKEGF